MVMRVYQPTNALLASITVTLDPRIAGMFQDNGVLLTGGATALEQMLDQPMPIVANAADYTYTAAFALTTVVLSREQPPLG
jgi:hypothetical protein